MIQKKYHFLLLYLIFWFPPDFKHVNAIVTGRIQFFRNKYFDERSIHAEIGRDMSVMCNNVKAFNAGKPKSRDDNDIEEHANDNISENRAMKAEIMENRYTGAETNDLVANNVVNKQENRDFTDMNIHANKLSDVPMDSVSGNNMVQKREVMRLGSKSGIMEPDGPGTAQESAHQQSQAGPDSNKRMVGKHYNSPEEMFRKKNTEILKNDLNNLVS